MCEKDTSSAEKFTFSSFMEKSLRSLLYNNSNNALNPTTLQYEINSQNNTKFERNTHYVLISATTLMVGGLIVPALFSDSYFSMKKEVWRSQISWLFLIHYEYSECQKIGFSQWFLLIKKLRTDSAPPFPLAKSRALHH